MMDGNSRGTKCYLLLASLVMFVVLSIFVYSKDTSKLFSAVFQTKLVKGVVESVINKHKHSLSTKQEYYASESPAVIHNTSNNKHTVLIWTQFYVDKVWSYRRGMDPFKNTFCNYDNCRVTYDKAQYASADVILFHCRDDIGGWPPERPRGQLYGVFCLESPIYSELGQYGDRLNITLSYRRDSDVFTPYHQIVPRTNVTQNGVNVTSLDTSGIPAVPLADRLRDVVWPVSHCITGIKRETYAKELGKYIDVDIFGACGTHKCPRDVSVSPPVDSKCEKIFRQQYKFYLSFENSYCTDYITEKFFKAYWIELIPIVFGRTDYRKYYPPRSFIDIRDYNSPKQLAEYLHYLSKNESAFNEYFEWKRTFVASRAYWFESIYCGVCQIMNNKDYKKTYQNPQAWWAKDKCNNDVMNSMQNQW